MAINIKQGRELLQQIDALFNNELLSGLSIPAPTLAYVKDKILGPAFEELRQLLDESRPPSFYLIGRSGHGKSSLINALAGKTVAEVGHGAESTTAGATPYRVEFPDRYATFLFYDSRGLFEIKPPRGAAPEDPVAVARDEILQHDPHIILHVMAIAEGARRPRILKWWGRS